MPVKYRPLYRAIEEKGCDLEVLFEIEHDSDEELFLGERN
jgi:hypothetical protein